MTRRAAEWHTAPCRAGCCDTAREGGRPAPWHSSAPRAAGWSGGAARRARDRAAAAAAAAGGTSPGRTRDRNTSHTRGTGNQAPVVGIADTHDGGKHCSSCRTNAASRRSAVAALALSRAGAAGGRSGAGTGPARTTQKAAAPAAVRAARTA